MRNTECPECRWVPVVDGSGRRSGRRRLEMRWQPPVATTLARAA